MKHALSETRTTWMQRIFPLFSLIFLFGAFFAVSLEANAATWKVYSNLLTKSCGTESPSGSGNWTPTSNVSCPTDGSTCSTVGQQVGCGTCSCAYNIPRCMLGSTAQCEDSSGSGGGSGCGTAAKSYSYTDTSFSGSICRAGWRVVASDGSGSVSFPAAGSSVTWRCTISTSPSSTCTATRSAAPITCGSANGGTFSASGPPSSGLCSDGSRPTVSYRLSGGYKIGFSWTCGTNSCSANLSPGVCGSANGTTISTAPSTASELCSFGSASSISGSGPWTWSCTGTSCRADKAVSSCVPSCPSAGSYCTTSYLGADGCGGSCGYGSASCSQLKVCPSSITINPLETYNLVAKYWSTWSSTSLPSCSNTGWTDRTANANWSRSSGLATTAAVGNDDANGAKGLVTAGSPSVNSSITARAIYSGRSSTAVVGVNAVSGGASATISGSGCPIGLGSGTCEGTFTWSISGASSPSVFNNTTSAQYTTNPSGTNVLYPITYGDNTVQARDGATVLASTSVTGTCASGTWDSVNSVCAAAASVDLKANGADNPTAYSNQDVFLTWSTSNIIAGSCNASIGWTGVKADNKTSPGENMGQLSAGNHTFTLTCKEQVTNADVVDSVLVGSIDPPCICDPSEEATKCIGGYTNTCGASCTGTKDCKQPWVEVQP